MEIQKKLIIGMILLMSIIPLIQATNLIDNNQLQVSNTKFNDTGAYYNDGNSYRGVSSGTADVVVCKSNSSYNDVYMSNKLMSGCDINCLSTSTCGDNLNNAFLSGNKIIHIKGGFYNLDKLIKVYSNTSIYCEPDTILNFSVSPAQIQNTHYGIYDSDISFHNCVFKMNLGPSYVLQFKSVNNLVLDNIQVFNTQSNAGAYCSYMESMTDPRVFNSYFSCGGPAVMFKNSINPDIHDNVIESLSDNPYSDGVWLSNVNGGNVYSNNIDLTNGGYVGILLEAGTKNVNVYKNSINGTRDFGMFLTEANNNKINGNYISYSRTTGGGIGLKNSSLNEISNNHIWNNYWDGILLNSDAVSGDNCDYNQILGNTIYNNNQANLTSSSQRDGIKILEAGGVQAHFNTVVNNLVYDDQTYHTQYEGISVAGYNNTVINNQVYGSQLNNQANGQNNYNYFDNWVYSALGVQSCNSNSIFNNKMIRNSTNSATCINMVWYYQSLNPNIFSTIFTNTVNFSASKQLVDMGSEGLQIRVRHDDVNKEFSVYDSQDSAYDFFITNIGVANFSNNVNVAGAITTSSSLSTVGGSGSAPAGGFYMSSPTDNNWMIFYDTTGNHIDFRMGGNAGRQWRFLDSQASGATMVNRLTIDSGTGAVNTTGNMTFVSGKSICLDGDACLHSIKYNGSCIVAVGDPTGTHCI